MTREEQLQIVAAYGRYSEAVHHPVTSVWDEYTRKFPPESPEGDLVYRFMFFEDMNPGLWRKDH